jgi:NAD+ kinase
MIFKSAGLFGRYQDSEVRVTLTAVRAHLEQRGLAVYLGDTTAETIKGLRIEDSGRPLRETIDLGVVVGGDGTMLHVARSLAHHELPMIGINLGRLGFLTDIPAERMLEDLDEILRGDCQIEERMMLHATITHHGDTLLDSIALNDIVLAKGATGRMIEFDTRVNGEAVGRTRGDGVILSTPTGSTAYALSAGGPILHPLLPAMLFAPICPHTLGQRPIVLDASSTVEIELLDLAGEDGNIFIDGLHQFSVGGNEVLHISRASTVTRMIRINSHSHYNALHSKLGWG